MHTCLRRLFARVRSRLPYQEVWLDGLRELGGHKNKISEAEKREVRLRTSLDEVAYSLAGRKIMEKLE